MIDYRIRVEDPETWTAPFTLRLTITQQPGYQLYEYPCHEGNGAVGYALSGERAYERMVADAKAKGLPDSASHDGDGSLFGCSRRRPPAGAGVRRGERVSLRMAHDSDGAYRCPEVRRHLGAALAGAESCARAMWR